MPSVGTESPERSHVSTAASAHTGRDGRVSADRYWVAAFVRALVALAAGCWITFTAEHSARVGLGVYGGFAALSGIIIVYSAFLLRDSVARWLFVAQGLLGLVMGIAALALMGQGLGVFLYGVSVWALLTGFTELYCGWRGRRREAAARDWMVTGGITVILAIVFVLIPPDALTAVGLFGAYAVVIAVYLGIGAFTLKFGLAHEALEKAHPIASEAAPVRPASEPAKPAPRSVPGSTDDTAPENATENHA
jgi:uncharacterized membrane protein HdeD (DUF308 family)